jgi:cytidylate kinase
MIIGFIGDMGSGKTLSMIAWASELYFKGFKIYSNLIIKGIPYTQLTLSDLIKYADSDQQMDNIVILLDEAQIFIDSRGSMQKRNQIIGYFITQTRKRNCWLFFTTQQYHQVDKRLRANTNAFAECSFKEVHLNDKIVYLCLNKFQIIKQNKIITKPIIFNAEPYFKYYDTRQVIKPI